MAVPILRQSGEVKVYVPNVGYVSLQGANASTDGSGNQSAILAATLTASGAVAPITPVPPTTPVGAVGTAVAAAALTVTLAATANVSNYLTGFDLTMLNVTTVTGLLTVTGLAIGTLSFQINDQTAAGLSLYWRAPLWGLIASAQNVAISVVLPAIVGGGASAINVYGYRQ